MASETMRDVLIRLIAECGQAITDAESWSDYFPMERPLDVEEFRVLRDRLRRALAALEAGDVGRLAAALRDIGEEVLASGELLREGKGLAPDPGD